MPASPPRNIWPIYLLISGYLIVRFLSAVLIPGGGWPLSPAHYLSMAIDLCLLIGLFGTRSQLNKTMSSDDSRQSLAGAMFVGGIVAGIGLLLIRFTSDAAWWTGHLR